ncbi:hypothetical protein SEA_FINKLE_82 [Gordonia phage Finkle]|uniref:Uncharacterized protein n=1 Tax=Gordonia phage Finkle TaxID=2926099 RepID=A0A9E7NHL9_9CAUD|nr:hypothetical protein QEH33_gp82 [Gordonia phage Finkle]UTN92995.1 hypothetical protein SEA_FINKLE_82 [Gordonia phage Finkle]
MTAPVPAAELSATGCSHGDGAHWLGDAGDLCDYRYLPPAAAARAVNAATADVLALFASFIPGMEQVPPLTYTPDDIGPIFASIR